jgi:hypothetical protein
VKRIIGRARLSRQRVMESGDKAPRLLENTPYEVIDLKSVPPNDLDYYAYVPGRLQDAAREVIRIIGSPQEIVDALTALDAALPNLRAARNPLLNQLMMPAWTTSDRSVRS